MKKYLLLLVLALVIPTLSLAGEKSDDPILTKVMVNQFELRVTGGDNPLVWDAEGWIGKDLQKLWIKTDGEYVNSKIEDAEIQALYSRAIAPFWDLQMGWRHDIRPTPTRDWLTLGLKGLSPYFFDIDTALFFGENGRTAARLQAEYEVMLTQRLTLVPEIEINLYGKNDPSVGIGSGLSDIEAGVRLRYEVRREFAPYIGVNWTRMYGNTADYARDEGTDVDDVQFLIGVRAWF